MKRIWQEYDCPNFLVDADLHGAEMVCAGDPIYCYHCGEHHRAVTDVFVQTYVDVGGETQFRPAPVDRAQLAEWTAEADEEQELRSTLAIAKQN